MPKFATRMRGWHQVSQRVRELEQAAGLADLAPDEDSPASVDGQLDPERADDADCSLEACYEMAIAEFFQAAGDKMQWEHELGGSNGHVRGVFIW